MKIDELLIDFDEMGFAPTTLCENSDEYACEWRRQLVAEIEMLKTQLEQANAGIVNCSGCKLVEINAVRDFAEKLKEKARKGASNDAITYKFIERDYTITESELNELLKEYEYDN